MATDKRHRPPGSPPKDARRCGQITKCLRQFFPDVPDLDGIYWITDLNAYLQTVNVRVAVYVNKDSDYYNGFNFIDDAVRILPLGTKVLCSGIAYREPSRMREASFNSTTTGTYFTAFAIGEIEMAKDRAGARKVVTSLYKTEVPTYQQVMAMRVFLKECQLVQ